MKPSKREGKNASTFNQDHEPDNDSFNFLPLDLLTLTDRKPSLNDSELSSFKDFESCQDAPRSVG